MIEKLQKQRQNRYNYHSNVSEQESLSNRIVDLLYRTMRSRQEGVSNNITFGICSMMFVWHFFQHDFA